MNKIDVTVVIGYIEIEPCDIDTFIDTLDKYRAEYNGHISLSPDSGYGGFHGYNVIWTREETDEEYNTRIEAESKKCEEIERQEMKHLMNKKSLSTEEKSKLLKYIKDYM
ncbi:TPA: hypothetical protein IHJ80_004946 [Escherichia coli]|uniref:Uncharacterized protein n=1 Tax=Escherichia phage vB_Eco_slurp01 TaxID=1874688 RepID=A0A1C3S782_9CAUD|nr:hypothetical protein [Escherichia coli]SCA80360.1 hypothetical protein PSLUR01_00383 [Escherichia phage vB_Eco_slurp01]HAO2061966.1 hypothetical protein [Escherichia coli]